MSEATNDNVQTAAEPTSKPRGFAAMDRDRVKAIASKGGRCAHEQGVAHKWTSEEAVKAGRKGGVAPHKSRGRRANRTES